VHDKVQNLESLLTPTFSDVRLTTYQQVKLLIALRCGRQLLPQRHFRVNLPYDISDYGRAKPGFQEQKRDSDLVDVQNVVQPPATGAPSYAHRRLNSFAVVLLTGDDRGGPIDSDVLRPRGRQNVVFELGYFVGRVGRRQVCTLYEEAVEIPSDFSGIVYIPLDAAGAWRTLLARELKAAGFEIDLNRAL
jgi:hypothetical protein